LATKESVQRGKTFDGQNKKKTMDSCRKHVFFSGFFSYKYEDTLIFKF